MSSLHANASRNVGRLLLTTLTFAGSPAHRAPGKPAAVSATLSEWKVELSQGTIAAGSVTFSVRNAGTIPHAFEVEGQGIEQETRVLEPGSSATLTLAATKTISPVADSRASRTPSRLIFSSESAHS